VFIRILISNKTPQTGNEKENHWGYRLGFIKGLWQNNLPLGV
jgi:hypothetical protein